MRKVAIHAIFTIACEVVNTRILVSFHMSSMVKLALFGVILGTLTFIDCEVLFWTEAIDTIQLLFEFFKFQEIFVQHSPLE